jgi:serine protease Do
MGTGIVIDPRGYVITNHHVVEDVNVISVRLHDRSAHSARVVARDPESDLALLKVEAGRPLPTIPLGTAADLMVGERVIAIGNAYGYDHTMTTGIVSAINRDVNLNKEISYKKLIQTDAAINPGNSGGPLLNIHGELIGVNVAIRAGAQCISFAIPVETMIRVGASMLSTRKRNGVWHGIIAKNEVAPSGDLTIARTEPALNPYFTQRSCSVDRLERDSPAARAGLMPGDQLVQVADLRVACSLDIERALLDYRAGDHVPVVVRRNAVEHRLDMILEAAAKTPPAPEELVWKKLGLKLGTANGEQISRVSKQLNGGLLVNDVRPDSVAAKAGIQKGDVLVGLHQWETLSLDNVIFVLTHKDLASFNPLCFYIVRSGQIHRGWLPQVE